MSTPIVIVGAGVAGLVCAIELQRAGRDVVLLEAAPDVGGRVRTTRRDGFLLDHGFQVLFTAYPTLRRYLDLERLAPHRFQPAARIASPGHVSLIGDALREPGLLLPTIRARAIGVGDKLRLLTLRRFAQALSVEACFAPAFANVSTRAFLAARGFSPRVIDGFFAPFYGGILLDRSLGTSASVLLFTFKMLATGDTVVPASGMGAIAHQLAAQLRPGTVRTGTTVRRVLAGSASMDRAHITGVQLEDGTTLEAAHVVLATEAPAATSLAASVGLSLTEPMDALGCTTIYFTAARSPIPGRALWLDTAPDAVISHAVTLTDVAPSYAPEGRILIAATAVGAAADRADDEIDRGARAALARMGGVPAAESRLERVGLWRVPFAQFAQPPGSAAHRPVAALGLPGLWRASEVLHSSSLDGAARGGVAAAHALLHSDHLPS